jgi:single-strand DNA-binding protein
VFLEGRLQTRKYDDRQGNARKVTEVVVSQLRLLAGGKGSANGKDQCKEGMTPRQRRAAPAHDASSLGSDVPF